MKRITPLSLTLGATLALTAAVGIFATAFAEPNPMPNSAVVQTRIFNDCPTSTVTVTNNYPSTVAIEDAHLDCFGFANLHTWNFSENGTTAAEWDNNSGLRFGADLVISGSGDGEAGLLMLPWFSNTDGRFNVRTPDGEIAIFGGRLPFYTFTGNYGLHYVKGETIHIGIEYDPHSLSSTKPATIIYTVVYHGNSYSSGPLPFDQGNASEDPPHGQWGDLNPTRIGGYFQPRLANGTDVTTTATWNNITYTTTPVPNSAVVKTRIFNDCPTSTVTVTNNYPTQLAIEDAHLDCFGFANLHNWQFSENGTSGADFNNDSRFRYSTDLVISGTGNGEAGLLLSPWFSQDTDGRFNVRTPDGEIACFGGRIPFYTFTGAYGLHYVAGENIHLEIAYDPHTLTDGDGATITYNIVYQGTGYTSGPLPFDKGNVSEEAQHGVWGILNDARVGGYFQPRLANGGDVTVKATWSNVRFTSECIAPVGMGLSFKPSDLNLKSNSRFVTALLTPIAPHTASEIDVASVQLNGVAAETSPAPRIDNGGQTLVVRFSRAAIKATLSAGDNVPITATGEVGSDCFESTTYVQVSSPQLISPVGGAVLAAGSTTDVNWQTPADMQVQSVTLLSSFDDGVTWNVEAQNLPNTGHYTWNVPQAQTNQARLSIVTISSFDETGPVTESEFAVSDGFVIHSTTGVGDASVAFALRGVSPNPAKGPLFVNFSLPTRQPAKIALYDVSGRQVASREVGSFGPGQHSVSFGARGALRPGVYMVRLTQGSLSMTTRAVVIE